jgi:hypothetical protein
MDDSLNLRVGTVFLHSASGSGRRTVRSAKTPGDRREVQRSPSSPPVNQATNVANAIGHSVDRAGGVLYRHVGAE